MLKLKIGKKYITRRGSIATILHIDMSEKCFVYGRVNYGENLVVYTTWTLNGRQHIDGTDDEFDIIDEVKEEEDTELDLSDNGIKVYTSMYVDGNVTHVRSENFFKCRTAT